MQDSASSPCVIVGIDGSQAALGAALWAVEESVSRDVPLRLLYAIEPPNGATPRDEAHALATAENAIRSAFAAVESTAKPVKIEVEILQARATRALLDASRSAVLICVGSRGLNHITQGRIGSTAAALAESALCPVAIIRGHDPHRRKPGWVVAEVSGSSASTGVLRRGFDEACLRGAPLRVVTTWQSRFTDAHDSQAVAERNRLAQTQLDRRLAVWKKRCPDLDVQAVAVHGSTLDYLARNAGSIQLVVAGRERERGVGDLVGPPVYAVLHSTDCSVLICESQRRL